MPAALSKSPEWSNHFGLVDFRTFVITPAALSLKVKFVTEYKVYSTIEYMHHFHMLAIGMMDGWMDDLRFYVLFNRFQSYQDDD